MTWRAATILVCAVIDNATPNAHVIKTNTIGALFITTTFDVDANAVCTGLLFSTTCIVITCNTANVVYTESILTTISIDAALDAPVFKADFIADASGRTTRHTAPANTACTACAACAAFGTSTAYTAFCTGTTSTAFGTSTT